MADQVAGEAAERPPLARLGDWAEASAATTGGDEAFAASGWLAADLVAAAMLVERDVRFGAVIATLQAPAVWRRPCLGLLAMALRRDPEQVARMVASMAVAGFITIEHEDEPRAEQTIRVPAALLPVIEGTTTPPGVDLTPTGAAPTFDDLVLPPETLARVERAAALLDQGELEALILRGPSGTGRRTVLRAVAGRLGSGLIVAGPGDVVLAPAVAVLTGAMLAWSVDPGLGQLAEVRRPAGVGPVGVVTGTRGAVRVDGGDRAAVINLPTPDPATRRRFWTDAGLPAAEGVLEEVSTRFVLSGGTIGRVAAQAGALAHLEGRPQVEVDDVRQAAQDQGRQRLESLAALLAPLPEGLAPVLSGTAADAYEALVLRSRHREGLAAAIGGGAGTQLTRGVRAMLSGPSGTGKTLAARALGTRLGLDVYRADLAALVDKYIGETERRLDELFNRAEELDVVLLIDEGDALMTRRTDVRSSNDRYANLETDYLLQRLETYEGIVLVTTNAAHLVDTAFQRRLDASITFAPPGPGDRLRIWQQHLPERHAVTPSALDRIANACRLTGGQIANASVHAALLALEADRLVDDALLTGGVEREFTVAGLSSPLAGPSSPASPFERALARP